MHPNCLRTRHLQSQRTRIKTQQGQVSIMLAMMMFTFILFFAFVINIGMLVNIKINLQNAADLAAYSGAAVQARQLTSIGFLNYEMRRQYKKFIFRYNVLGGMAQKSHVAGSGPRRWSPDNASTDYGHPAVCILSSDQENPCQVSILPHISIPQKTAMDSINDSLIDSLKQLEQQRQKNCGMLNSINEAVMHYWIWNTNPDLAIIEQLLADSPDDLGSTTSTDRRSSLRIIKSIGSGLGIVPKEILIRERIDTLKDYINTPAQKGVTMSAIQKFLNDPDAPMYERTMNAYQSAYYTLGNNTFGGEIMMDELLPGNSDAAMLLKLQDFKINFKTYSLKFDIAPDGSCVPNFTPHEVSFGMPMAVVKDLSVLTYYAVRLKAQANIMFSPYGPLELKAYAAAMPFGSRIGPQMLNHTLQNYTWGDGNPGLPIKEGENASAGWALQENIWAFYTAMQGASGNVAGQLDNTALTRGYAIAMAANPYEKYKYLIPNSYPDNYWAVMDDKRQHTLWAPIISSAAIAKAGSPQAAINDILSSAFGPTQVNYRQVLMSAMSSYFGQLQTGAGEDNEGMNRYILSDPQFITGPDGKRALMPLPPDILLSGIRETKSSYNNRLDGEGTDVGRTGYSVKLISLRDLIDQKLTSDGAAKMINPINADGEMEADLTAALRH